MSKIIEHTSNGFKWLLVEVPEDGNTFDIKYSHLAYYQGEPSFGAIRTIMLPSGSWEIVGKADSLDWKDKVPMLESSHDGSGTMQRWYKIYDSDNETKNINESFESLLRSHGLKESETLILKSTAI